MQEWNTYIYIRNSEIDWMMRDVNYIRAIKALWPRILGRLNEQQWINLKYSLSPNELKCITTALAYVYNDNATRLDD